MLIELGSLDTMLASSHLSAETVWQNWIASPSVRRYESGRCSDSEFAQAMIEELSLALSPDEFLHHFHAWPKGVYAGAEELLHRLAGHYRLACLSNTNMGHMKSFLSKQEILGRFDHLFLSHETGLLKPDPGAFEQVTRQLEVNPETVLFLDDNPVNVDAALRHGFAAACVNAPEGVLEALKRLELPH